MNDPEDVLASLATIEELEKTKRETEKTLKLEREKHKKEGLAKIEELTKTANANLEEAANLAETYGLAFNWTSPGDSTYYTYIPASIPEEVRENEYYSDATGWTTSSDMC